MGGEAYQGVNNLLLTMRTMMAGYTSPFWMTIPQANALDAKVRKGEKTSVVVYYGQSRKQDEASGNADEGDGDETRVFRFQKSYRVFNADQIDGLPESFHPDPEPVPEHPSAEPIPHMQTFFGAIDITTVFAGGESYYLHRFDQHTRQMARGCASDGAVKVIQIRLRAGAKGTAILVRFRRKADVGQLTDVVAKPLHTGHRLRAICSPVVGIAQRDDVLIAGRAACHHQQGQSPRPLNW